MHVVVIHAGVTLPSAEWCDNYVGVISLFEAALYTYVLRGDHGV